MKAASLYRSRVKSYAKVAPPAADAPGNANPQPSAVTADRLGDSTARDVSFFSKGGMAPGGGGRFAALKNKFAAQGKSNPAGLAAYIGRQKYGAKKFGQMAAAGRKS